MSIKIGNLSLNSRVYVPPMAGVTDLVFRNMIRRFDKGCMLATEMVSSRALMHKPETRLMDLEEEARPTGIQIFGHEPDVMAVAAQMAESKGADFVDINMGCPVPKITKGKDGCALMKEPELARAIVSAVKDAIKIPLTVKFRLGWDDQSRNAVEFGQMLEATGVSAVTVHGRTRQQLYSGQADWSAIAQVKRNLSIPVFGNGDVFEADDAIRLLAQTGCDGVAVARGTLGNPWLIAQINEYVEHGRLSEGPSEVERLTCAYRHALGLIRYKGARVGTNESRRHLTHYTKGIVGSAPFRARLTQVTSEKEIAQILGELALKVAGIEGQREFLAEVENINFAEGKDPAGGESPPAKHFEAPVNLCSIGPVAEQ